MSRPIRRAGLFAGLTAASLLATACTTYDSYGYYDQGQYSDGYYGGGTYGDSYYDPGYARTGYLDDGYYGAGYYGDGYYYSGSSIVYSKNVYYPTRTGWLNRHNRNYRHRDARPYQHGYRGVPPRYRDQRPAHYRHDRDDRDHRRDRHHDRDRDGNRDHRYRGDVRTGAELQRGSHNGYRNRNDGERDYGRRRGGERHDTTTTRQQSRDARTEARVSRREALQTRDRAERTRPDELLGGRGRPSIDRRDRDRGVVIP